jgi:hypothetical protein
LPHVLTDQALLVHAMQWGGKFRYRIAKRRMAQ